MVGYEKECRRKSRQVSIMIPLQVVTVFQGLRCTKCDQLIEIEPEPCDCKEEKCLLGHFRLVREHKCDHIDSTPGYAL